MAVTMIFTLAACGSDAGKPSGETGRDSSVQSAESSGEPAGDSSVQSSGAYDGEKQQDSTASESHTQEPASGEASGGDETAGEGTKALVVYFSATGNTKVVAETIADLGDADIYEIVPEQPYTDEDLNYNDRSTRATAEQNDPEARPAIQGSITDFEQYEVIYVGYPIWWGDMPRVLYTFFDAYDFSGKTIAPFCTSGGSGLSGTPGTIAGLEVNATVLDGLHVSDSAADSSESKVAEWLDSIGQAN